MSVHFADQNIVSSLRRDLKIRTVIDADPQDGDGEEGIDDDDNNYNKNDDDDNKNNEGDDNENNDGDGNENNDGDDNENNERNDGDDGVYEENGSAIGTAVKGSNMLHPDSARAGQ